MAEIKTKADIRPGNFPFPLSDGPTESPYLTWLRNHSNYMVESGFSDYLRIVAVLVRGMVVNFLILLPFFLVLSVALALAHLYLSKPQAVVFEWIASETADAAGDATVKVTVRSTFGERASLESAFAAPDDPERLRADLGELLTRLLWAKGQFDRLKWTLGEGKVVATDLHSGDSVAATVTLLRDKQRIELKLRNPTRFTIWALGAAALLIVAFPVGVRMSRVRRYREALRTGHLSSIGRRDLFERRFGSLLLAVIAVAAFENFPRLSSAFHALREGEVAIAVPTLAGMLGGLVAANRVLPSLGGWAKKIGVLAVGLLGLLLPLVLILFVVEFLVYTDKSDFGRLNYDLYITLGLVALPLVFAVLLFVTLIIGWRSFKWSGVVKLLGLILLMLVLIVGVVGGAILVFAEFPDLLYAYFVLAVALEVAVYCWLAADVNQTSINGLYRDRLASAFLIGVDTRGDIGVEQDINIQEICNYDAGSSAPYHIINTALNLQATTDTGIRERNSDFFMFSKRFTGSDRTGYCKSENMEAVFPQMDLGTAMAISAAAASPNMGRSTNPLMVMFLTLLNIRLGFWVPHPDRLEKYLAEKGYSPGERKHITFFDGVFPEELGEIARRRAQAYGDIAARPLGDAPVPTVAHNLVGIGFSGGGIRSATINLGIAQALHARGVFDHVDYMSTVSGGGYLGASISTLMRHKTPPHAEIDGRIEALDAAAAHLRIAPADGSAARDYRYVPGAALDLDVAEGLPVKAGQRLLRRLGPNGRTSYVSLMDSFSWRVPPGALWDEMISHLDENHKWLYLSDGGHIENMAAIELLRRRCRFIIIGDGEADPRLHFFGLATLIRYARIDLGITITLNVDRIRLGADGRSAMHWATGTIRYPPDPARGIATEETGHLLYLKSSFTGDEDEVIQEYRNRKPAFPHESTADQMFDENQFEAYRALGQHIAETALARSGVRTLRIGFDGFETWMTEELWRDDGG